MESHNMCEDAPSCGEHDCAAKHCCRVEGCEANLAEDKAYAMKKRLCSAHMRAASVTQRDKPGQLFRFCFQCGKLQPLNLFDGTQRSCRDRLELRRRPKRSSTSGNLAPQSSQRGAKRSKSCVSQDARPASPAMQQQQQHAWMRAVPGEASSAESASSLHGAADSARAAHLDQLQQHQPAAPAAACSSAAVSAAAVAAQLAAPGSDGAAAAAMQDAMRAHLSSLQDMCDKLKQQIGRTASGCSAAPRGKPEASCSTSWCDAPPGAAAAPVAAAQGGASLAGPVARPAAAGLLCSGSADHSALVQMVVAHIDDDSAEAADQLEAMIEEELRAAALLPPGACAATPALQLHQEIEGLSRSISGVSSASTATAALPGAARHAGTAAAAAAGRFPLLPAAAGAAGCPAAAPIGSALTSGGPATLGAAAAAPSHAARLHSLQGQLAELHQRIGQLREQMQGV